MMNTGADTDAPKWVSLAAGMGSGCGEKGFAGQAIRFMERAPVVGSRKERMIGLLY